MFAGPSVGDGVARTGWHGLDLPVPSAPPHREDGVGRRAPRRAAGHTSPKAQQSLETQGHRPV